MQSTYTVKFLISHLADPHRFQEELTRVTDTIKPSFQPGLTGNKPRALFLEQCRMDHCLNMSKKKNSDVTRNHPNQFRHAELKNYGQRGHAKMVLEVKMRLNLCAAGETSRKHINHQDQTPASNPLRPRRERRAQTIDWQLTSNQPPLFVKLHSSSHELIKGAAIDSAAIQERAI